MLLPQKLTKAAQIQRLRVPHGKTRPSAKPKPKLIKSVRETTMRKESLRFSRAAGIPLLLFTALLRHPAKNERRRLKLTCTTD